LVAVVAVMTSQGAASPRQTAARRFNIWTPAIAVYEQEYGTYAGTKSKLARFD
jgi:hypothetical protein